MLNLCRASKVYKKNGVRALDNVNLSVHPGEYVSVTGASGSGKSTLMNILGLLDTLTEGQYILAGEDVSRLSQQGLARLRSKKVGFVFQRSQLIPGMTALENVALPLIIQGVPLRERMERASDALRSVGLSHRASHKPGQLSGGQQQRVAVARAVVTNPGVILADEPTSGLDPEAAKDVLRLFSKLHHEGNTVVLITHDPVAASMAGRQLHLESGVLFE